MGSSSFGWTTTHVTFSFVTLLARIASNIAIPAVSVVGLFVNAFVAAELGEGGRVRVVSGKDVRSVVSDV